MVVYPTFYRKHGIWKSQDVASPSVSDYSELVMPKESILHYLTFEDSSIGPDPNDPFFVNSDNRVLVEHINEHVKPIGNPKPNKGVTSERLKRDYHRRYRKMRPLNDFSRSLRDEKTLIVENYAGLSSLYIYMRSIYGLYYRNYNVLNTVFHTVNTRCKDNDRQHFIPVTLPRRLPSLQMLKKASGDYSKIPRDLLSVFSQPNYLIILEIWKWLGEDRQYSTIANIDPENYDKINFIWMESGKFVVFNLGKVLEVTQNEVEEGDEDVGSSKLQRLFLRMLISLFELRNAGAKTSVNEGEDEKPQDNDEVDGVPVEGKTEAQVDEDKIEKDIEKLSEVADREVSEDEITFDDIPGDVQDPTESLTQRIQQLAEEGGLSPAQVRRYEKIIEKTKNIPNPYGDGKLLEFSKISDEDLQLSEEEIKLPDVAGVTDESMTESTLKAFDSKYLNEVLKKDIVNCAMDIQRAGITVLNYDVEEVKDAANDYQVVTMQLAPVDGDTSTIRFKVPNVKPNGEFISNNVKYRLRKQRSDKPIRKVSPSTVSLTSYYAKVFVDRSEKSVVNYPRWIIKQTIGLSEQDDPIVTNMRLVNCFDNHVKLPRIYTIMSERFREFTVDGKYRLFFDYNKRLEEFGEDTVTQHEKEGFTFAGQSLERGKAPILVDENNVFYIKKGDQLEILGPIETLLGLDASKAPVEIAEFRLFSKTIPVAMVLGFRFGLSRLMSLLGVQPRRVPVGSQINMGDNEFGIRFADETLILTKDDPKAQLILAGFNRYHKTISRYNVDSFDDPEIYENVLEDNGLRVGFIRELELAMDMFVDPITRDLLEQMGEPTALDRLLIRACELLTIDWHPDETDMEAMRIRGYERMAGAVFSEITRGVRRYRSRGVGSKAKIEINPEAVWQVINQDPSISQVEESNPIQNLKEKELVTYMGTGGRSTRSMVKHTRRYHPSDMGVISEATPDSGAVGVNTYLTANPQFANLRGLTNQYESGKTGSASMLSTSALLAPGSDIDDPKRVNFVSIQNTHVVSAEGYETIPLRTGYERVIAHRVDDLYAYTAKGDGEIVAADDEHVRVKYKDGTEVAVEIGTRYGSVTGTTIPHQVMSNVKVGDKVKEGNVITYNSGFFAVDPLDPKQVLMKGGILVKTAIMERSHTFEDASVISEKLAGRLGTKVTKVRTILVSFDQNIRNLVNPGDEVDIDSLLCMIEDSTTSDSDLFSEDSLDSLKLMSANAPKAKVAGKVEKIEAFYHGDVEDMHESVKAIAKRSDRQRVKRLKALGEKPSTGQVDGTVRIEKDPLDIDTMAIKVYITKTLGAGIGDKGVLGNQMKTVFSSVMTGTNQTKSGTDLDMLFGYMSINNRIVLSPELMGTTNTLLKLMSKRVADKYFSTKK